MPVYNQKVMDHFSNPRNVGEIPDADGIGEEGNPVCGDMMTFYIKVKDNRLEDVKFKTFGCGAAIAVSSMVSEMAMGKTLEEALKITPRSVADELEGLPKNKFHCSNLGAQALEKAIKDYQAKQKGEAAPAKEPAVAAPAEKAHACPFCDGEVMEADLPYCKACGVKVLLCPNCKQPVGKDVSQCPKCGASISLKG
ncbi:MAG: Fe-S cluster assembly scaffold protein NifU [Dehalococcoidales bacterium]|jgi:nitrogen fixation NifU-like protein